MEDGGGGDSTDSREGVEDEMVYVGSFVCFVLQPSRRASPYKYKVPKVP